jgi:hypothetical protein
MTGAGLVNRDICSVGQSLFGIVAPHLHNKKAQHARQLSSGSAHDSLCKKVCS